MKINEKLLPIKANKLLWTGGLYMNADHSITLREKVSEQEHGIVLHWQPYVSSEVKDYNHVYFFIPKQHVIANNGSGVNMTMMTNAFGYIGTKYLYIHDDVISGNADNIKTGTNNGVTFNNKWWILTQVIGV